MWWTWLRHQFLIDTLPRRQWEDDVSAICERCGATVNGSMCDLCGGTRFVAAPSTPPPPDAAEASAAVVDNTEYPVGPQPVGPQPDTWATADGPPILTAQAIPPTTSPDRNSTKLWVIAGCLGVAVVVLVAAVSMQLSGHNSTPAAAVTAPPGRTSASASLSPESSPSVSEDSSLAPSYTCWDGGTAESLDSCGVPEGVAGLKYVFPGLATNLSGSIYSCSYVKYPKRDEFTFSYDCPASGSTMEHADRLVRYRYWEDGATARKHYRKVFSDGGSRPFILDGRKVGTVYWNNSPKEYGRYVRAFTLFDGRIVLSVEGSSPRLLDQMLREAQFRAADELYGYSGAAPSEGTWTR